MRWEQTRGGKWRVLSVRFFVLPKSTWTLFVGCGPYLVGLQLPLESGRYRLRAQWANNFGFQLKNMVKAGRKDLALSRVLQPWIEEFRRRLKRVRLILLEEQEIRKMQSFNQLCI